MKIVVLDGYALNPGDLSWEGLKSLGEVEIYDRTSAEETVRRASGAEIILTNKTMLLSDVIGKLPDLKYIGVLATGYNVVDLDITRERGIVVTNVPAYSTMSVAQHVFALILEFFNVPCSLSEGVRNGRWSRNIDFCYWDKTLTELDGLVMGIVGFGKIGQAVARIGEVFGLNVLVHTRSRVSDYENCSLEQLLEKSDIVSLHCPLTPETRGMINAERLGMMKPSALLVNTARGPLVIEQDLADALNKGIIAGACLDVLSQEPPGEDNPLLSARNCIITPHVAWATLAARKRLMKIAVSNVREFLAGSPVNVVNM
ncbi:MAG TPA: D-2-hydroxyacid dehydrogenase [Bacteroidales bacterium]|jgi:glycerate dehydrogenase|nr:D-2-hydroxyacid dehydrogenase [Bacteroidales bacterium]HQH25070.1 D-2-hydroxyacid dehydrogenase [Bacteroidales bacterium]HQJ82730.1 D-2-hydroxyacid dehydrogenase [Bacteroidales bacterium]